MIPKIVHQTWRSHILPNVFQNILDRNKVINQDFEFKLWTHSPDGHTIDDFIKKEYPDIFDIYINAPMGVQKADIARLTILHYYGGVYIDLDIMTIKPLSELIDCNSNIVYAAMEPEEQTMAIFKRDNVLCNAFICSPAKHQIFRTALDEIKKLYEKHGKEIYKVFNIFGADIVTVAMTSNHEDYKSCRFVHRKMVYPICDPKLEMLTTCENDIKMLKTGYYNDAYMVHYWIHSDFESKELLEKYVFDNNYDFHGNIYQFFKQLYPSHKYLK